MMTNGQQTLFELAENSTQPVIRVDIDGILTKETFGFDYANRTPRRGNIDKVNQLYNSNQFRIVLWSARWEIDRPVTLKWLERHKVKYHELVLGKPQYYMLIDDKARSNIPSLKDLGIR